VKKSYKGIKKKTSIFRMYGKDLLMFIIVVGVIYTLIDAMTNPAHSEFYNGVALVGSMILLGIVAIVVVVGLIYVFFKLSLNFYHQTKLPLKKEEMEKLNITNPDEYVEFVYNYLQKINMNKNIENRVVFTSYLYLYNEDSKEEKENVLHNTFKFSKVPVCADNYEYIYDYDNNVTVFDENYEKLLIKIFSQKTCERLLWYKDYERIFGENTESETVEEDEAC